MVRVSGQRPRVRGGSEPRCWAGMWPALGGGERGRGEGRGLQPSTGPSPLTGTEPELSLHRAERTAPDTELPRAPDTKVHLRPQATGCHHLLSCPTGEVGTSGGHWSEGWGDPPRSSAPCWVSRKGGPFPLPRQATGPARYARTALERRTFHAYFVLATVQKELTAPALAPGPALISHPSSSQLAS